MTPTAVALKKISLNTKLRAGQRRWLHPVKVRERPEADSSDAEEDIYQYKTSEKPPEPEAAKQSPKDSFSKQLESSKRKIPTILTL